MLTVVEIKQCPCSARALTSTTPPMVGLISHVVNGSVTSFGVTCQLTSRSASPGQSYGYAPVRWDMVVDGEAVGRSTRQIEP